MHTIRILAAVVLYALFMYGMGRFCGMGSDRGKDESEVP